MTELYRHIGADTDVPAGDIGVGAREIGYMFGQYKQHHERLRGRAHRQGPDLRRLAGPHRGHRLRPGATSSRSMLEVQRRLLRRQDGRASPAPATWPSTPREKATAARRQGGHHVRLHRLGVRSGRASISRCSSRSRKWSAAASPSTPPRPEGVEYHEGRGVWVIPCDIALPCATQNELHMEDAKSLVKNGCIARRRGRQHAHHPRGDRVPAGARRCCSPRARRPTPAAWPPPVWR